MRMNLINTILSVLAILMAGNAGNALAADNGDLEAVFKSGETMTVDVPLDTASVINGHYTVDSMGYVKLPVMGNVYVHNRSVTEIQSLIASKMSAYMRDTHVTVTPVIRLAILGSWKDPGMYYVNPDASVWDACIVAGSPVYERKLWKWKVMRGTTVLPIVLADEFSHGTSLRNAGIRSGDIFVIPVPDPNSGFWYWFKESLTATAQVATVAATAMTAYLTYKVLDNQTTGGR
ncbi:MAG: polysaccharide biosynthesis/export family protein [Fibrobacteria bacterium]